MNEAFQDKYDVDVKDFDEYMQLINEGLEESMDLNSKIIADFNYRSVYDSGESPLYAVQYALENEYGLRAPDLLSYVEWDE